MDFQSFFDTEIEEFEDDGKYSEPNVIEEEYDAINDETFGVELHDTEGDLEEFANRTASFLIEEPSCSSTTPNRKDGFGGKKTAEYYKSIWNNNSGFNGVKSPLEALARQHPLSLTTNAPPILPGARTLEEIERAQLMGVNSRSDTLPALSGASPFPQLPPIDSLLPNTPISVEELERRMLLQASMAAATGGNHPPASGIHNHMSLPLPHSTTATSTSSQQNFPPPPWHRIGASPALVASVMHQQNGGMLPPQLNCPAPYPFSLPPPGLNPLAPEPQRILRNQQYYNTHDPQNRNLQQQAFPKRQYKFVPRNNNPMAQRNRLEGLWYRPKAENNGADHYQHNPAANGNVFDNHRDVLQMAAPVEWNPHQGNKARHNSYSSTTTSTSTIRNRPKGLPSSRTISDFALDPYAGFMSKKEREWLIKIHLIQCMRTGDPLDDDFYYSKWKKRNVLKKGPPAWQNVRPRYYSFEDTYPSSAYIPPSFAGTLGKPTHCTASFPRHLIDVPTENTDDDEMANSKNTQKKLKAMLMRIENAAMELMEYDENKRKLVAGSSENEEELKFKLNEHMERAVLAVCTVEVLPTVMLIQKGRTLLFQIMECAARQEDMFSILKLMIESMPKYAKKVSEESVNDLVKQIFSFLGALTKVQLVDVLNSLLFGVELAKSVKLIQYVIISLLIVLAKLNVTDSEITKSSSFEWLTTENSASEAAGGSGRKLVRVGQASGTAVFEQLDQLFAAEELVFLKHWLTSTTLSKTGCVAQQLLAQLEISLAKMGGNDAE